MGVWIRYKGPPDSELPEPIVLPDGVFVTNKVRRGSMLRLKPSCSAVKHTCQVENVEEDKLCPDGRRRKMITVRSLSTLN